MAVAVTGFWEPTQGPGHIPFSSLEVREKSCINHRTEAEWVGTQYHCPLTELESEGTLNELPEAADVRRV